MTKFIVSIFALCFSVSAFATQTFDELVRTASAKGEVSETAYGIYHTLQQLTPNDRSVAHQAEYFSVVGWNYNDAFEGNHLEVVSENWKIDEKGNWDVEQWGFVVFLNGTIDRFMHNHLVEQPDGLVLADDEIPTTAAESQTAWQTLLLKWENTAAPALP